MKTLMIALLVAAAGSASAATPTEIYVATKETAVASLKHPEGTVRPPGNDRIEADALRSLAALARTVIGPLGVRGFPAQGESNIVSLSDGEMESGHVDGLRAVSPDGSVLLVTTVPLVRAWLEANAAWWSALPRSPATGVEKALESGDFYTQALASEAAVNIYADFSLSPGAGGSVRHAYLTRKSQDTVAPLAPDGLMVSVVRGDRVIIIDRVSKAAPRDIPPCKAAWTAEDMRIRPLFAAAAKAPDTAGALAKVQAMADKAESAFMKCYGEQVVTQPFYPGLIRQAREMADLAG